MKFRFSLRALAPAILSALTLPVFSASAFAVSISSSTHAAFVTRDFNNGNIPFVAYQREGGVPTGARFKLEDGALTISNEYAGSFGVDTKTAAFDAEKYSRVVFDYALNPDVKVNFFFRLKETGIYHGATFSGPKDVRPGSVLLGEIPGIVADRKWHRAEIPLRDWLRKLYPTKTELIIDEIIIGNWDNEDYLMALGVGGNGVGATWKIDNFSIIGDGPAQSKFEVRGDNGEKLANAQEYSWSLDGGAAKPLTSDQLTVPANAGFHVLQILDKARKVVGTQGFWVAEKAPSIGQPELRENTLRVPIESDAGLVPANLKLTVGGRAFQLDSPYLTWDGAAGVLSLQADEAGLQWKDKQSVPVVVEGVQDVLQRAAASLNTSLVVDFSKHKAAPPVALLERLKEVGDGSFETSLDEWAPKTDWQGAAILERDSTTAAGGKYSLRLTSPVNAGNFGAYIRRTPFDAAKYPVIEFDYKIPPELRADFVFDWNGQQHSISFTDRTPQWSRVGTLTDVIADGQWHHAQIRLFDMMRATRPGVTDFRVNWFAIADGGWLGNYKGLHYWIDNFQFTPVVPGAPFESKVLASDVTGLQGVSWSLDGNPKTDVPAAVKSAGSIQANGSGAKWLHLRVQNGAGQWSPTSHLPLLLDTSPPTVGAPVPAAGSKAAAEEFQIPMRDDTSIDVASIALTLQGREYTLRDAPLTVEAQGLVFSLERAVQLGQLQPLTNGARVAWTLKPVRDVAGQSAPETSGEWTHDFAQDKLGPEVLLSTSTHVTHLRDNFDQDFNSAAPPVIRRVGRIRGQGGAPQAWQVENLKLDRGKRDNDAENPTLRATTTAANTPFVLRLMRGWDHNQFPMVGFFYKAPAGTNIFLRLRGGNAVAVIKFLGNAEGTPAGEIAGAVADGQWHWAQLDLNILKGKFNAPQIQMVEFVNQAAKTPADTAFEIDDFTIQKAPPGNVKLNWRAFDISGVQSHRFAWDQNPTTVPTEVSNEITREVAPGKGTWWAHVQSQDNAGNWGEVEHLPILMP